MSRKAANEGCLTDRPALTASQPPRAGRDLPSARASIAQCSQRRHSLAAASRQSHRPIPSMRRSRGRRRTGQAAADAHGRIESSGSLGLQPRRTRSSSSIPPRSDSSSRFRLAIISSFTDRSKSGDLGGEACMRIRGQRGKYLCSQGSTQTSGLPWYATGQTAPSPWREDRPPAAGLIRRCASGGASAAQPDAGRSSSVTYEAETRSSTLASPRESLAVSVPNIAARPGDPAPGRRYTPKPA